MAVFVEHAAESVTSSSVKALEYVPLEPVQQRS